MILKPQNWLDRVFALGLIAKGLNGLVELIGGLALLFVTPGGVQAVAAAWTRIELSEDPHDVVAAYLLHTADGLTGHTMVFGAIYLLAHGVVKIILVSALLANKLWAYPWMIGFLTLFIGYQIYRIALSVSPALIALTLFDIAMVALTWREFRRLRAKPPIDSAAADVVYNNNKALTATDHQ